MEKTPEIYFDNKLPKAQRLHGRKAMSFLFTTGKSFFQYPFKVLTAIPAEPSEMHVRFLVTVSKRNFKRATDRNKIKRQVREAWRTQKQPLFEALKKEDKSLDIALIFTPKNILPSSEIKNKIKRIIERLLNDHEVYNANSG
jgi:ribonuclease P protein component